MASSVLHSGMITLIAVIVLAVGHKSYFFEVFTKLWIGIIIFGMFNAFVLAPVILSFLGPTPDLDEKDEQRRKDLIKHKDSMNENQLKAMVSQYEFKEEDLQANDSDTQIDIGANRRERLHYNDIVYPVGSVYMQKDESQIEV